MRFNKLFLIPLGAIIIGIVIVLGFHSRLDIERNFCKYLSLGCPYKGEDYNRYHHMIAYYRNPLFFKDNILVLGSEQYISNNTIPSYTGLWRDFFQEELNDSVVDTLLSIEPLIFQTPLQNNDYTQRGFDVCKSGNWRCISYRLSGPEIMDNNSCVWIIAQDEGSENIDKLSALGKSCYIIDLRNQQRDSLIIYLKNI